MTLSMYMLFRGLGRSIETRNATMAVVVIADVSATIFSM